MKARLIGVVVVVASLLLAGCSGIPRSSRPTRISSVGVEEPSGGEVPQPQANVDARTIVSEFLAANGVIDPGQPDAASLLSRFLTQQGQTRWDAATVTILSDDTHVGQFQADSATTGKIVVTGTEIGTIDKTGVYTPALSGDGFGSGGPGAEFRACSWSAASGESIPCPTACC